MSGEKVAILSSFFSGLITFPWNECPDKHSTNKLLVVNEPPLPPSSHGTPGQIIQEGEEIRRASRQEEHRDKFVNFKYDYRCLEYCLRCVANGNYKSGSCWIIIFTK